MGDRASYAIRDRRVDVRYAHFGSPFLFADVFWGPAEARAFIESLEKGPWLDDVYGEAAAALCFRTKAAAIYTYQLGPVAAAVALRLMQPLWPGWRLRFGTRLTDVTPTVGVDLAKAAVRASLRGAARRRDLERKAKPLAQLGERFRTEPYDSYFSFRGVISLGDEDRLADVDVEKLLFEGPRLLAQLQKAPTLDEARGALRVLRYAWDRPRGEPMFLDGVHALIDVGAKRVVVSVSADRLQEVARVASAHAVAVAWPGWTVDVQAGGERAHFAAAGRAFPAILDAGGADLPRAFARHTRADLVAALRHIRALLFGADDEKEKGAAFVARASAMIGATDLEDGVPPKVALSVDERRRRYDRAVRDAGWTDADAEAARPEPPSAAGDDDKDASGLFRTAYYAWRDARYDAAWTAIERALALEPGLDCAAALAGRVCFSLERYDDAVRLSRAAIALRDDDHEAGATLALVAGARDDVDDEVRCYRRAIAAAPKPWLANNLACALLGAAEVAGDDDERRALCAQALAATALSVQKDTNLHWADACAYSMQRDADRAYAAVERAVAAHDGDKRELERKLRADPQLAFLWKTKGKRSR